MRYKYSDEQAFDEDLELEDSAFDDSEKGRFLEDSADTSSYEDEDYTDEDDGQTEPAESSKGKRQKSAERLLLEKEFLDLYEEYMHPTKEYSERRISWQLDDLYAILMKLNRGWAYRTAQSYKLAGYVDADGEEALAVSG